MFTIVSYDITNDRRRTKVLKLLKGYGTRVQYSVFECDLDQGQLGRLQGELAGLIDSNTDSVRIYRLDAIAQRRIRILGIGRVTTDPLYYSVWGE
jgi:CRISPR-associated protein Cas2